MSSTNREPGFEVLEEPAKPSDTALSVAGLCGLIRVCGKAGVRELRFGNLHVIFDRPVEEDEHRQSAASPNPPAAAAAGETQDKTFAEDLEKREAKLRQEQADRMILEDPDQFEDLLALGELVDEPKRAQ